MGKLSHHNLKPLALYIVKNYIYVLCRTPPATFKFYKHFLGHLSISLSLFLLSYLEQPPPTTFHASQTPYIRCPGFEIHLLEELQIAMHPRGDLRKRRQK